MIRPGKSDTRTFLWYSNHNNQSKMVTLLVLSLWFYMEFTCYIPNSDLYRLMFRVTRRITLGFTLTYFFLSFLDGTKRAPMTNTPWRVCLCVPVSDFVLTSVHTHLRSPLDPSYLKCPTRYRVKTVPFSGHSAFTDRGDVRRVKEGGEKKKGRIRE